MDAHPFYCLGRSKTHDVILLLYTERLHKNPILFSD